MYNLIRSFLFLFDAEKVHYFSMNSLKVLCKVPFIKKWIAASYRPKRREQYSIFNIKFSNKVGLGAGFDKNAKYLNELEALGFGFVEIGTVTPLPQDGNPKPRLFRLPKDKAIINRMGFNNDGMDVVADRLKSWKDRPQTEDHGRLIIGGNIGKNKITPNEDAWLDYEKCFLTLYNYVDYFVVNVSSPNTPGLRELQDKDSLRKILTNLQNLNFKLLNPKPILLKIAPDLTLTQIDDVIDLAMEIKLDGLVATNTTISRDGLSSESNDVSKEAGGLSGAPLKQRSTEIVKYISDKTNGKLPVIASGGILTGTDAKEKIDAGASLIQVWTGFIYQGPAIVKNICSKI
ncbi:quinone-dependent dihydroorotate dehydrogenase [Ferruginibacter sp. SUN002]|uniref:quinone-dependent dihydroorotate dehydrogenase n=1 Tax=Ferruginibacter sp. SUN002 TaxID=2937789 RepID=UPI003D35D0DC